MWSGVQLAHILSLFIDHQGEKPSNPIDAALAAYLASTSGTMQGGRPAILYPFDAESTMSGAVWHHGREYEVVIKGTPETILTHCDLTESEREDVYKMLAIFAAHNHQVIAVAYGIVHSVPPTLSKLSKKDKLIFAGLIKLA